MKFSPFNTLDEQVFDQYYKYADGNYVIKKPDGCVNKEPKDDKKGIIKSWDIPMLSSDWFVDDEIEPDTKHFVVDKWKDAEAQYKKHILDMDWKVEIRDKPIDINDILGGNATNTSIAGTPVIITGGNNNNTPQPPKFDNNNQILKFTFKDADGEEAWAGAVVEEGDIRIVTARLDDPNYLPNSNAQTFANMFHNHKEDFLTKMNDVLTTEQKSDILGKIWDIDRPCNKGWREFIRSK